MKHALLSLLTYCILSFLVTTLRSQITEPNFIFIVVDDLNDYVEQFTDQPQVSTPHFRALGESGTVFLNAYSNAAGCAPSRTSFLSGKDLSYTKVFNNESYESSFRDNFRSEKNNEEVFTLPEILKDSGGYFTYAINKVYHKPSENDFDNDADIPSCEKKLSWNKMTFFDDTDALLELFHTYSFGGLPWGAIPDSLEYRMEDVMLADTAIAFLEDIASGTESTCGKPFFLALGFHHPHSERYIPQKYFPPYFLEDIYTEPFDIPYNNPAGTYPYNGIVMPPQPEVKWADYDALPEDGIARSLADMGKDYEIIYSFYDSLLSVPEIDAGLTGEEKETIIEESVNANYVMTYMAAVNFIDAQIGRVLNTLKLYPELSENTIIVLVSDNAYSLGEKRHWTKWSLWETDIRVPFIISDPSRLPGVVNNATVSLLDLFPTICDLAGVVHPLSADGTEYLDGHSLVPFLSTPSLYVESPVITTYKKTSSVGSCYPHYSIRNNRFHYIRYRENNDGAFAVSYCDSFNVSFEEELYEIGQQREVDPHEWNNLIANEDYQPVIEYLEQWMPDSILYLQKTFGANIQTTAIGCFAEHSDTILLSCAITDTSGLLILPPPGYTYRWTTNLSPDTIYGSDAELLLQNIDDMYFFTNSRILVYFQMIDNSNGAVVGFDLEYIYINNENTPSSSFNLALDGALTVSIVDFEISGSYNQTWWDYGDGFVSYDAIPGPHTYSEPGDYHITHTIQYGNDCIKTVTRSVMFDSLISSAEKSITVFPNPADEEIMFTIPHTSGKVTLTIFDLYGRIVSRSSLLSGVSGLLGPVDVSEIKTGMYVLEITDDLNRYTTSFVIVHQ